MDTLRRPIGLILIILLLFFGSLPALLAQDVPDKTSLPEVKSWKIEFEASSSAPVIVNDVLYVGSADGAVYALDANTGEMKWRYQTGENIPPNSFKMKTFPQGTGASDLVAAAAAEIKSQEAQGRRQIEMTPAVEDGTVFVGSEDHLFYAIDAATGQKKWSYETGPGISFGRAVPAAVITSGNVYFISGATLHAVDVLSGKRKWQFDTPDKLVLNPPVLGEGVIFLAASPGPIIYGSQTESFLYALDPDSGKANWTVRVEGVNISAPLILKDSVLFSVTEPTVGKPGQAVEIKARKVTLYAVDAASGKTKWKFDMRAQPGRTMLIAGKMICLNTSAGLFAFEVQSGHESWSFTKEKVAEFVANEQYLYASTYESGGDSKLMLRALDLSTGKEKWSRELSGYMHLSSIKDGVIYLDGDYLLAADAATGKELWTFKEKEGLSKRLISVRLVYGSRILLDSPSVAAMDPNSTERVMRNYPGYFQAIDLPAGKQ